MKIKRYRLSVSRYFPSTHPRKGEETGFVHRIMSGQGDKYLHILTKECFQKPPEKLHTIRANYPLWAKRMAEVQAGRAVIELFYWSEKPYRSQQVVFATLDRDSGCGVQELDFIALNIERPCIFGKGYASRNHLSEVAKNDGLSLEDFKAWFKGYDLSKSMAIIHFTDFRY